MTTHRAFLKALIMIFPALCSGQSWAVDQPAIEIKPGEKLAQPLGASGGQCPESAYLLSRRFTVGDEAVMRISDIFSKVQTGMLTLRVTRVDINADRVELNDGECVMNSMGNFLKTPESGPQETLQQIMPAELQLGKKWSAKWVEQGPRGFAPIRLDMRVAAFEKVSVPAGEFDAFRIEGEGWFGQGLPVTRRYWISPGLNFPVRYEHVLEGPPGKGRTDYFDLEKYELAALRQQVVDIKCMSSR